MSRLVIDVSADHHQQIKALASLQGKTIKDFVLGKIFATDEFQQMEEKEAWSKLESFLSSRIEEAERLGASKRSFEQIIDEMLG